MDGLQKELEWKIETAPVAYPDAVSFMEQRVACIAAGTASGLLWCLEHPPLYTAGTSAKTEDLIDARFPVFDTGRGGQYTYHGPGQRIVYVMLDLSQYYRQPDIRAFVYDLEEWVIRTLDVFGVCGQRRAGRVGIWVIDPKTGEEDKIAALGIRVRRGVSYHGFSININPDLSHFSGIVPCGILDHGVTSFHKLGVSASQSQVDQALKQTFSTVFCKGVG